MHDDDTGKLCRAPWRLAIYYLQSRDERILPLLQAQLRFFEAQTQISAGYKLDGTAGETYSNIAFQAPVSCHFCAIRMLANNASTANESKSVQPCAI